MITKFKLFEGDRYPGVVIYEPELIHETHSKLDILKELFNFTKIAGLETGSGVAIDLDDSNLGGNYDEELEIYPVVLTLDSLESIKFNWHPYNSMGGLDIKMIEKDLNDWISKNRDKYDKFIIRQKGNEFNL